MFKLKQKIFKCCFLLLFYCERKHSCIWLALLQGELRSLFFGEPHRHTACFKCIKLRRLEFSGERILCLSKDWLPASSHSSHSPASCIFGGEIYGTKPTAANFLFFPKNRFLLSGLLCTKHRHTIYLLLQCPELRSSIHADCGHFCKHKAFSRCKDFIL